MKLGIIQGRLSPPVNNEIQEFPKNWLREFSLLNVLGLNHIEWIVTEQCFYKNPIRNHNLRGLSINSICLDKIIYKEFYKKDNLIQIVGQIIHACLQNNIGCITIPLLEESNVEDDSIRKEFIDNLNTISKSFPDIIFSIEAELQIEKLKEIIDSNENFFVTYDTGNITSYKISHEEFIETFIDKINNVHLKDRTFDKQTVSPGNGDTHFPYIFKLLQEYGYNGLFTIQTARGKTGNELQTIKSDIRFFKEIWKNVQPMTYFV